MRHKKDQLLRNSLNLINPILVMFFHLTPYENTRKPKVVNMGQECESLKMNSTFVYMANVHPNTCSLMT